MPEMVYQLFSKMEITFDLCETSATFVTYVAAEITMLHWISYGFSTMRKIGFVQNILQQVSARQFGRQGYVLLFILTGMRHFTDTTFTYNSETKLTLL